MTAIPRRLAHLSITILTSLLIVACQRSYFWAINLGVSKHDAETVVFDPVHRLSLDIYRPHTAQPAPVVVFIYGGRWRTGERNQYRFVGAALAQRGVLVLIPDYRKAPTDPFPAFMDDVAQATAWARAHAAAFGGNPAQLYLMGHSAGAQIAALLATDARYLQKVQMKPHDLRGVIGLAGPYDFLPILDQKIKAVFGPETDWPRSQPVNFVDGDEPPFLLLHGANDKTVLPFNSEHLASKLREAGEPVTLRIIAGTGHIGLLNGFYSPKFSPVLEDSMGWIKQQNVADVTQP